MLKAHRKEMGGMEQHLISESYASIVEKLSPGSKLTSKELGDILKKDFDLEVDFRVSSLCSNAHLGKSKSRENRNFWKKTSTKNTGKLNWGTSEAFSSNKLKEKWPSLHPFFLK